MPAREQYDAAILGAMPAGILCAVRAARQRTLVERRFLVSFFNDVDVGMEASWVPAVEYLGARGFFDTYDAAPDEPLQLGVGRAWARITASLLASQADAGAGDAAAEAGIRQHVSGAMPEASAGLFTGPPFLSGWRPNGRKAVHIW